MSTKKRRSRPRAEKSTIIADGKYVNLGNFGGGLEHLLRVCPAGYSQDDQHKPLIGVYNTRVQDLVTPIGFEEIYSEHPHDEGWLRVTRNGCTGLFCWLSQSFLLPLELGLEDFQRAGSFRCIMYKVKKNGEYGLFDSIRKKMVMPPEFYFLDCDLPWCTAQKRGESKSHQYEFQNGEMVRLD
jgi:hypothetical protein